MKPADGGTVAALVLLLDHICTSNPYFHANKSQWSHCPSTWMLGTLEADICEDFLMGQSQPFGEEGRVPGKLPGAALYSDTFTTES
jgi:hypothetical protein